ncbi:MAG: hypothetical protein ACR2HK_07400 [Gemmatimonadales bacterium]
MSLRPGSAAAWEVPELGPSLGRLTDAPSFPGSRSAGSGLDDIRLRLVTSVFELAGAGRSYAAAGDPDGAMAALNRGAWLAVWERTVSAAAERLARTANTRLAAAATESHYPAGGLRHLLLTADDTRAVAARLGAGGGAFVAALDELEQTVHAAGSTGKVPLPEVWQSALTAAARRLEAAWLALEAGAAEEGRRFEREIHRVHSWRRPLWPLWALTLLVLGVATYLGLVLGGYVPVPPALRGLAEFWWTRW